MHWSRTRDSVFIFHVSYFCKDLKYGFGQGDLTVLRQTKTIFEQSRNHNPFKVVGKFSPFVNKGQTRIVNSLSSSPGSQVEGGKQ